MAESASRGKHGFFQSITSVLPTHNPLHLHRHRNAEDDIIRTSGTPATTLSTHLDNEPPSNQTRKKAEQLSAADQLTLFRSLVGIDNPPGLHASTFFRSGGRPADNVGIYARVVAKEAQAGKSYKMFSAFISFCISAQVLVAACLTALGAGNASHRAVTAFGALNTVLAGFMAYFKGSGLPNRLKYYKNEWTKLREYIEQRERDFCRTDHNLDLEAEVLVIERMYEEVKGDIEANTPDSFVSVRDISKRGGAVRPGPAIAAGAGNVVEDTAGRVGEVANRSVANLKRNLSYQSSHFGNKVDDLEKQAFRYGDEKITSYGDRAASYGDEKITSYGQRMASYTSEKAQPYQDLAKGYQEQAKGLQQTAQGYQDTARGYQEAAKGYQEQARQAQADAKGATDQLGELGKKAYDYAGRISSFIERPHSIGVTVDPPRSPPPAVASSPAPAPPAVQPAAPSVAKDATAEPKS